MGSSIAPVHPAGARPGSRRTDPLALEPTVRRAVHIAWVCIGVLIAFVTPVATTRVFGLDHRGFVLVHLAVTLVYLTLFFHTVGWPANLVRRWRNASLALGVAVGTVLVLAVVAWVPATPAPSGASRWLGVAGRGVVLGTTTAGMQVVVPVVASRALAAHAPLRARRLASWVVAVALVWATTTAHHVGFAHYNGDEAVAAATVSSVPALPAVVTGNPVGSVMAGIMLHTAIAAHAFESSQLAPPPVDVVRDYRPPGLFLPPDLSDLGDRTVG